VAAAVAVAAGTAAVEGIADGAVLTRFFFDFFPRAARWGESLRRALFLFSGNGPRTRCWLVLPPRSSALPVKGTLGRFPLQGKTLR
jgi:hypothetical protein